MFTTKVYEGSELAEGARLALKHRLYINGWCLQGELEDMERPHAIGKIALGFMLGIPIVIVCHNGYQAMAFCRKILRGHGYASECLKALNPQGMIADEGIAGTAAFWAKNGVTLRFY